MAFNLKDTTSFTKDDPFVYKRGPVQHEGCRANVLKDPPRARVICEYINKSRPRQLFSPISCLAHLYITKIGVYTQKRKREMLAPTTKKKEGESRHNVNGGRASAFKLIYIIFHIYKNSKKTIMARVKDTS